MERRAVSAYGRLVLWALRTAGSQPAPEMLELWGKVLAEAITAPNGREAVVTVLRYLVQVLGDDAREIIDVLAPGADDQTVREDYVTRGLRRAHPHRRPRRRALELTDG
jgi:hypothetical protein